MPSNILSPTGTYDGGSGPRPLFIQQVNSFRVTPSRRITAETGTTFLILSMSSNVTAGLPRRPSTGPVYTYSLSFQQDYPLTATVPPVIIKPLLAGTVTTQFQTYYMPLFPCVAYAQHPFAGIPAVTIPHATSAQDLDATLGGLLHTGSLLTDCQTVQYYDYTNATLPPGLIFLPLVRH